MSILAANKVNR